LDYLVTCLPAPAAIVELAHRKDVRAIEPLKKAYKPTHYGSGSGSCRLIAWALGMIGDARGIPICSAALADEVPQTRMMGLLALRELVGAEEAAKQDTAYGGDVPKLFRGDALFDVYEGRMSYSAIYKRGEPQQLD
jgi:hypothetical protein